MPTQHSLHASKVAGASLPRLTLSYPMPGVSTELPIEQGYKDIPLPASSDSLVLIRRPGYDQGVEYKRKFMNEQQARFEQQIHKALNKLGREPHDALSQQCPPIYVMKA